jgi:hypothetical protein
VVAESRALRKIVRSAFLPNISGYLSETVQQLNPGATGFSFDQRISQLIPGLSIPTVVVPFNYFDLRATLTQKVMDITAWKNYGPAKWIVRADDETAEDAEDLIALAGRPDRAGRRRCLSSGDRGESEVGSDARPTGDRRGALSAGSRTAQRRRHRADRPQSRPD